MKGIGINIACTLLFGLKYNSQPGRGKVYRKGEKCF